MQINKVIFIITSIVAFVSCNKNEINEYRAGDTIAFNSQVDDFTNRALSTFGVIDLVKLKNSTDGFAVATNGLGSGHEMNSLAVTYNGSTWTYTGNYYWPTDANQNVSFTAYAPVGTNNVTFSSSGLTLSNYVPSTTIGNQIDILYALQQISTILDPEPMELISNLTIY